MLRNKIQIFAMGDLIERVTFEVQTRTASKTTTAYVLEENLKSISDASEQELDLHIAPTLEWWFYVIMSVCGFLTCLLLNFIVRKINDARLEERLLRLYQKRSTSTQVQGIFIEIEKNINPAAGNTNFKLNKAGVSMIFNKEENKNAKALSEISMSFEKQDSAENSLRNANSKVRYIDTVYNNVKCTAKESIGKKLSDQTFAQYLGNCRDRLSKSIESKISIEDRTAFKIVSRRPSNKDTKDITGNGIPNTRHSITNPANNSNDMLTAINNCSKDSLKKSSDDDKMKVDNDGSLTAAKFLDVDLTKFSSSNKLPNILCDTNDSIPVEKIIENISNKNKRQNVLIINSSSTKSDFDKLTNVIYNTELKLTSSEDILNMKTDYYNTASNITAEYENSLEFNDRLEVDSIYKKMGGDDDKSRVIYLNTSSDETKILPYEDEEHTLSEKVIKNNLRANDNVVTIRSSSAENYNEEVIYNESGHNKKGERDDESDITETDVNDTDANKSEQNDKFHENKGEQYK